jgi:type I restriction enzyme S subunit
MVFRRHFDTLLAMIRERLAQLYPGDFERTVQVRMFLEEACATHMALDLADPNFEERVCSASLPRHWQAVSEALIGHELRNVGLTLRPSRNSPDFLIEDGGRRIWVEVICPEPANIPERWLRPVPLEAGKVPHEAILLRWTAAIKEKAEKLLGNPERGVRGYLADGVVAESDSYVIAINGRLLRGPHFASITGISQWPYAVEATFAVGPYAVQINPETLEQTGGGHTIRDRIPKPRGKDVPADTFFDPTFRHVSAILAADLDGSAVIGNARPMAVIHNPRARNPVAPGLLPAEWDYVAEEVDSTSYNLHRRAGRLSEGFGE